VDVGLVFSTDGRIAAFGFYLLIDDRSFFPAYTLAPVVRREVLD
jgi:osmoprotectant transport system substrate-binding protein